MDKLKTTAVGGLGLTLDDFRWFFGRLTSPNDGMYEAFNNLLRGFGDNFIVQGCVVSGSTGAFSITEGWILLAGELVKVDAQGPFNEAVNNTFTKVTTFDSRGNKTFLNGSINDTYEKNRGVLSGLVGTLAFNGDRFAELNIAETIDASSVVSTTRLKKKVIEIGDWNMVSAGIVGVSHGLVDFKKVRSINALIRNDADTFLHPINFFTNITNKTAGGIGFIDSNLIILIRETGAFFDSIDYDSTSFNRGHIIIEYEA